MLRRFSVALAGLNWALDRASLRFGTFVVFSFFFEFNSEPSAVLQGW